MEMRSRQRGGDPGTGASPPSADDVIAALALSPHPEGGHFRETWRAVAPAGERSGGSAILYLLAAGDASRWHRVDADELWVHQGGDPLMLRIAGDTGPASTVRLTGPAGGGALQAVVPAGAWQSARPLGAWTLVACIVVPAFEAVGFELAPDGWEPGR